MPLAFESISHGTIAFGFFNIDSDMLLLDRYFFFATEFCSHLIEIAEQNPHGPYEASWEVYNISDPEDIGDLMGAIHGVHYTGFIGEVYRRFPFPEKPEHFRQKPEGARTRNEIEEIIKKFAKSFQITFVIDQETGEVSIGPYRFTRTGFQELIKYVWRGGYPLWKDEIRPDYVVAMKDKIGLSSCNIFSGLELLSI
jgi:hypothetical protein